MKTRVFTLLLLFAVTVVCKASSPFDLSRYLVTARDLTIYRPPINTQVRTVGWSDNSHYFITRNGSTYIPSFFYSPYAMCDGKVFTLTGYYTDNDYFPGIPYAILQVTISGTIYSLYWPLYLDASSGGITNYYNFLQPA